ncbi:MAG: hypothetical protein ACHQFX_00880 [Chitinophagales bacterium]
MKYFFLIALLLISAYIFSQDPIAIGCSDKVLLQKPGTWKAGMKGSEGGTAAELAIEKKVVATIHNMIKSKYTPMSIEAIFHGSYGRSYPNMSANNYGYSIIPLSYYCEGNSIKTSHESSIYFSIDANMSGVSIYDTLIDEDYVSGMGYHYMVDMPVEKDGIHYFKEKDVTLAFGIPGKTSEWLITYNGKLPYSYVTKKEFLEKRKRILSNAMRESAAGFKDALKRNEMEKGFKETEYKNEPEKLKKYMRMDYLPVKERYDKHLAENEKNYKPAFAKIETLLKMPAIELAQPAIVKQDPNDHLSYLFTDDNDGFGRVLIKPNPGYFNKKIPKSSPQFFWIFITGPHKDLIAAKFMEDVMKAVDFATLKNMLGK